MASRSPLVGIVMGSASDWEVMREAAKQLTDLRCLRNQGAVGPPHARTRSKPWVKRLAAAGARCFIAGGRGCCASGGCCRGEDDRARARVPMPSKYLHGLDRCCPRWQMPKGYSRRHFCDREAGAANAGLFAVAMLAQSDAKLAKRLAQFRAAQAEAVKSAKLPV